MQNYGGGIQIPIESVLELIPGTPGHKRNTRAQLTEEKQQQLLDAQAAQYRELTDAIRRKTPIELSQMLEANNAARQAAADRRRQVLEGANLAQAQVNELQSRQGLAEIMAPIEAGEKRAAAGASQAQTNFLQERQRLLPQELETQALQYLPHLLQSMFPLGVAGLTGQEATPEKQALLKFAKKKYGINFGEQPAPGAAGLGGAKQPGMSPDELRAALEAQKRPQVGRYGTIGMTGPTGEDWISQLFYWLGTQSATGDQPPGSVFRTSPFGAGRRGF